MNARHTPSLAALLERHREGGAFPTYAELSAIAAPAAPSEQAEPIQGSAALIKDLRTVAAMMSLGERISWGRDTSLMQQAAAMIESLSAATAPAAPLPAQPDQTKIEPQGWNKHFTPMEVQETRVYLGRSGGFDVRDCPEAESLAQFIAASCNAAAGAAPLPELTGPSEATDISTLLREYAGNPGFSHGDYADTMTQAADEIERLQTAKSHLILQAQIWHGEAKSQRATVIGILDRMGLPENDWEAERLIFAHIDGAAASTSPAPTEHIPDNQAGTWLYDERVIAIERAASAVNSYGNVELSDKLHDIIRDRNFTKATKYPPPVAAPVSQQDSYSPTIVDCDGLPQAVAAIMGQPRAIVGWANLYELIDAWGEGQRKHVADEQATSPASRMGGITSKESAETAAPGASQPMQILSDVEVLRLLDVGATWMSQDGRDALDDWLLAVQSPPVAGASTEGEQ